MPQAGQSMREAQRAVAAWVEEFTARGYGPAGGAKLVDGTWTMGAGQALRELGPTGPLLRPYVRLAHDVGSAVGDQSSLAVGLCGAVVRRVIDLGPRAIVEAQGALATARRQTRATLASMALPDEEGRCLASVADEPTAAVVATGVRRAVRDGQLDLDGIGIVVGSEGPAWHRGILVARHEDAARREGDVWVLTAAPRRVSGQATWRVREVSALRAIEDEEARQVLPWRQALGGAMAVVCTTDLGHLGELLRQDGVLVWEDAPTGTARRIAAATGAEAAPDPGRGHPGRGRLVRRRGGRRVPDGRGGDGGWDGGWDGGGDGGADAGGWWLEGPHAGQSLVLPAGVADEVVRAEGERLLRAAGAWAQDPRSLPGGGRWQAEVARSLDAAAPLVPGRQPLVVAQMAEALRSLKVQGATDCLDVYPAVRLAVDASIATALQVLRVDAVHQRRPSGPERLRGPGAPSHGRVRAGDVPPLM